MQDSLITFKTAKLAKEKKFNWKVKQIYDNNGKKIDVISYTNKSNQLIIGNSSHIYNICAAPTQSLLQMTGKAKRSDIKFVDRNYYSTYEEALEKGLFEALSLIK